MLAEMSQQEIHHFKHLTLTENHSLLNGETIRVISDNARLPDGLDSGPIYYSITSGVN